MKPTPANRPIRDRKSVSHYSDDNPQTFTVKKRKGMEDDDGEADDEPDNDQTMVKRRRRNRPSRHKNDVPDDVMSLSSRPGSEASSSSREAPFVSRKSRHHHQQQVPLSKLAAAPSTLRGGFATTSTNSRPGSPPRNEAAQSPKVVARSRPLPVTQDAVLAHTATIHPLVPPAVLKRPDELLWSLQQQQSGTTTTTASTTTATAGPCWTPLSWDTRLLADDQSVRRPRQPASPPFTCYQEQTTTTSNRRNSSSSSHGSPRFAILGDAVGSLWFVRLGPGRASVVQRYLETAAAQRELQDRTTTSSSSKAAPATASNTVSAAAGLNNTTTTTTVSRTTVSYPNAMVQVAWHDNLAICLTQQELQGFCVSSTGTTLLFTLPVQSGASNHQLLVEMDLRQSLLWLIGNGPRPIVEDDVVDDGTHAPSLWTISRQGTCAPLIPMSNQENGSMSESLTIFSAIWDTSLIHPGVASSHDNGAAADANPDSTILMVTSSSRSSDQLMVLCRYDTVQQRILQQTDLPAVGRHTREYFLRVQDEFIFVSSSRGIRLYESTQLVCLHVYGEMVSLHGKSVLWRSCIWMPQPQYEASAVRVSKKHSWLERPDEVNCQLQLQEKMTTKREDQEYLLVGIPHPYRGPQELQSSLSVWKPGSAAPLTSLLVPEGGIVGASLFLESTGWRMLFVTARQGQVYEWRSSMRTDFAGIQYPIGYSVTLDNVEYIEDEDELDRMVIWETNAGDDAKMQLLDKTTAEGDNTDSKLDPNLAKALRLSCLEKGKQSKMAVLAEAGAGKQDESGDAVEDFTDPLVSVLLDGDDCSHDDVLLPCQPQQLDDDDGATHHPNSPVRDSPSRKLKGVEHLTSLPQQRLAREVFQQMVENHSAVSSEVEKEIQAKDPNSRISAALKPKGKRNRATNIDFLIQSSVDPALRHRMMLRSSTWADGTGSALPQGAPLRVASCRPLLSSFNASSTDEKIGHFSSEQSICGSGERCYKTSVLDMDVSYGPSASNGRHENVSGCKEFLDSDQSPSLASKASEEEKEIARELLHLSPSPRHTTASLLNGSGERQRHVSVLQDHSQDELCGPPSVHNIAKDSGEIIVTPVEQRPTSLAHSKARKSISVTGLDPQCPACQGRFALHKCGKRERPVDYEAIERVERERKEREEKAKLQRKMEKRRAAEARRREARRKKKLEEEELRHREEESSNHASIQGHPYDQHNLYGREGGGHQIRDQWAGTSVGVSFSQVASHAAPSTDKYPASLHGNEFESAYPVHTCRPNGIPSLASLTREQHVGINHDTCVAGHPNISNHSHAGLEANGTTEQANYHHQAHHPRVDFQANDNTAQSSYDHHAQQSQMSAKHESVATYGYETHPNTTEMTGSRTSPCFSAGDLHEPSGVVPASSSGPAVARLATGNESAPTHAGSAYTSSTMTYYPTLTVNGTELKPSATLAACDALSALAGLADFMVAVPTEPDDESMNSSANADEIEGFRHEHQTIANGFMTHMPPNSSQETSHYSASHSDCHNSGSINGEALSVWAAASYQPTSQAGTNQSFTALENDAPRDISDAESLALKNVVDEDQETDNKNDSIAMALATGTGKASSTMELEWPAGSALNGAANIQVADTTSPCKT